MSNPVFELQVNEELSLVIVGTDRSAEVFELIDSDRAHLRRWLPWVDQTMSVDDTRQNIEQRITGFYAGEQAAFFCTEGKKIIASVGFVDIENQVGEIGYWVSSSAAGKGVITTCVRACLEFGFNQLALHKIVIKCDPENHKSAAVAQRLGFSLVDESSTTLTFLLERK